MQPAPQVAVIDANTLAQVGLRQILQHVVPAVTVVAYGTFGQFLADDPERFVHYFVSMTVVLQQRAYFTARSRKTIVLTPSPGDVPGLSEFHSLCITEPERQLVRQLLLLVSHAHGGGRNLPPMPPAPRQRQLTRRETEVISLVAQGYLNKQIADRLNIGLATVITHRKNIMEKLGTKSVSALTIYAVIHGYVDISKI